MLYKVLSSCSLLIIPPAPAMANAGTKLGRSALGAAGAVPNQKASLSHSSLGALCLPPYCVCSHLRVRTHLGAQHKLSWAELLMEMSVSWAKKVVPSAPWYRADGPIP